MVWIGNETVQNVPIGAHHIARLDMGQSESSFKRTYEDTVSQLSSVQLGEIAARFNELYGKAGGPKGHVVDREAFSRYFRLPVAVGDRLFDAFDKQKVVEARAFHVTHANYSSEG